MDMQATGACHTIPPSHTQNQLTSTLFYGLMSLFRFGYWGNGFTLRELDGRDTTFYYGLLNGKDEQPDYSDIRPLYTSSN